LIIAGEPGPVVGDRRLDPLEAVRQGRIFQAPQDEIVRRGARVDKMIERLSRAIRRTG
jgi:hypothetical protein